MTPAQKKMPFIMWRITVALIALPFLLPMVLLPTAGASIESAAMLLGVFALMCWAGAAIILRHYGRWPWNHTPS